MDVFKNQNKSERNMKRIIYRHVILAITALICVNAASAQDAVGLDLAAKALASGKDPLPGARTCFWARGPISGDPYMNIAFPDAGTMYWAAVFTVPENAKLSLNGKYPHSRFASLTTYDGAGKPVESAADYAIKPMVGSTNPFLISANRNVANRSYALNVVDGRPDLNRDTGVNQQGLSLDQLHAPKYGAGPGQQLIIYRIYARDNGVDETGGVGLPEPVLTLADGKVLQGLDACAALRVRQPLKIDPAAMAVPLPEYNKLREAAAKISPVFPSTMPPTWHQMFDREALYGMFTGTPVKEGAKKSEGGFYPNLDTQYIRTFLNRKIGKVFVMRGKAPTTPKTVHGDKIFGEGELRYWSVCSQLGGLADTRVTGCVHDENIPTSPDGYYTIVVSRAADRPRNAFPQCGIAWLPMSEEGDGTGDPDVTSLLLRHQLGSKSFKHAVQAISKAGTEEQDMGEYFPRGQYITTSAFEVAIPCQIEKR